MGIKKIKLVIIMHSELAQRWLDFFCLDKLTEAFDLEYWDCSDFVLPGFHFDTVIERYYVHKIHNLWELWKNLRRLPKDTLISNDVHYNLSNFWYHKLLSHYFPMINYVDFYLNSLLIDNKENKNVDVPPKKRGSNKVALLKDIFYKSIFLRFAIKYLAHQDSNYRKDLTKSFSMEMTNSRYQIYEISCAVGAKYKINHPDVETYLIAKNRPIQYEGRYMVYLDQFFPLHPDLREHNPNVDFNKLAREFYLSLNAYFSRIEKKFQCRIIIAAHPLSNFKDNPFDNREKVHNNTVELVKGSIGVLAHYSNAISYAMLFRKPLALLSNSQVQLVPSFYQGILKSVERHNFPLINMDEDTDVVIRELPDEVYTDYIQMYFGDIDESSDARNENLLVKHLNSVWHDMYDKA